jgi:hypothetical protein
MDGYVGLFIFADDEKILPYLELLRNSIYEYLTIELFEDTGRNNPSYGSSYVDLKEQLLKFTGVAQEYRSTNLVSGAVTTYNTDCVFYASVLAGSPTFSISSDNGGSWTPIASSQQYIHNTISPTATYLIKIVSTTANDAVESFGLIFSRKAKFRTVVVVES